MYEAGVERLQEMIDESSNIVFFGGAGVSTESNIPDFRSADGIYHQSYKYSPEEVVSHSFYEKHPKAFFEFYREKMMVLDAKPNAAHLKLAELENAGKIKAVITQNIDGLHQAAGSQVVYELHGSIHRNYCEKCGPLFSDGYVQEKTGDAAFRKKCGRFYDAGFVKAAEGVPVCSCGGRIKPDVVLYEEALDGTIIEKAVRAISQADMLIIGGTSLVVYPAAGFIDYFRGKYLVVINKSEMAKAVRANLSISAPIGEILGRIKVK